MRLLTKDERRFKQDARMSRTAFDHLCTLIESHPVFQNNSYNPQAPVPHQLLLTLKQFGCSGSGASVHDIAKKMGVSGKSHTLPRGWDNASASSSINRHVSVILDGTVSLWTKRVIAALLSLEPQAVSWPDAEERQDIERRIRDFSGFPSCVGFVDGTLIPLAEKPIRDGEDYYNRKGRYGISATIVCDDQKRVRYVFSGCPGCFHDARVFAYS